jgi:hypothetical protein
MPANLDRWGGGIAIGDLSSAALSRNAVLLLLATDTEAVPLKLIRLATPGSPSNGRTKGPSRPRDSTLAETRSFRRKRVL